MAGVTLAQPAIGKGIDPHGSHAPVQGCKPPQQIAGAIGRPIVDHDDLEIDILLREQAEDRALEPWPFVTSGDDHGAALRERADLARREGPPCRQSLCVPQVPQGHEGLSQEQ